MTLEKIKNDYSVSEGFKNWKALFISTLHAPRDLEKHMDNVCVIAQKECLKLASENVKIESEIFDDDVYYRVNKESITNENNLIK